jgi:hypothetical protein
MRTTLLFHKSLRKTLLAATVIILTHNAFAQFDSLYQEPPSSRYYFGYSITLATQSFGMKSDISEINDLSVSREGASVGLVVGNNRGSIKSYLGLYYSAASVPYSMDFLEAGISANMYLLRTKAIRFHTFEPYAVLNIHDLRTTFFGTYLKNDQTSNKSTSKEPMLGRLNCLQLSSGLGVEYQLENDNLDFIHLFAEVRYGTSLLYHTDEHAFDRTKMQNPLTFSFGVSFGKKK